jgi:hypothetical protein
MMCPSGDMHEVGVGSGKYYSVNVPLRNGIDDEGGCAVALQCCDPNLHSQSTLILLMVRP